MIRGILLAAGYGRRFDASGRQDKLLAPLADGRPVLWHSARALCAALPGSLAVVRPGHAERVRWLIEAGCAVLECREAELGMGSALAQAVQASAGASGWVVALADMPWLPPAVIRAVADAIDAPARVVAPLHSGQRGHPVGFGGDWGNRLAALSGDEGARTLLREATIQLLETDEPGVLTDVDTPADLRD
ncbi:nucleotidyltransferase family protein [Aromatoleum diolicum]|uniref:NTP transferase domain-containing protein n=1 Tax=Aromatoleum diolicum TaxID=75796 RepID=A0ABX1Q9F6_9RHOO|nr:nucleotidyltransferase family protein [Aromatoleum diolicum]NMG73814.1 NTP transferase domain-containing protein [Aromatoleum diolicum]